MAAVIIDGRPAGEAEISFRSISEGGIAIIITDMGTGARTALTLLPEEVASLMGEIESRARGSTPKIGRH